MKQRPVLAAVLGAALLLLTACAQSVAGAPQAASTGVSSSSTSSHESSSHESSSHESSSGTTESSAATESTETSGTSDATGTPDTSSSAVLDSGTEYWFTTFCDGITDLTQYASPDTSGQSLTQAQQTVTEAYTNIAVSAKTTVDILAQTPPPAVTNGDDLAKAASERLSSLSTVYGKGAQTIAALTPSSKEDLKTAIDAIEKEASDAQPSMVANVDPAVLAAARELPECQKVLN